MLMGRRVMMVHQGSFREWRRRRPYSMSLCLRSTRCPSRGLERVESLVMIFWLKAYIPSFPRCIQSILVVGNLLEPPALKRLLQCLTCRRPEIGLNRIPRSHPSKEILRRTSFRVVRILQRLNDHFFVAGHVLCCHRLAILHDGDR